MVIVNVVLPIFLIITAGFILRKAGVVKPEWVSALNNFVYYVSLPALVVISFWRVDLTDPDTLLLIGFNLAAVVLFAVLLLAVLAGFRMGGRLKAAIFLAGITGNTVYMGFPLLGSALGSESFSGVVGTATAHLVFGLVFSVLAVEYLVIRAKEPHGLKSSGFRAYAKDFFANPLVLSLAAGIILSLWNPKGEFLVLIQKPLEMLGSTASPVALFILGAFLHGKFYKAHFKLAMLTSALKLLIFPAFLWLMAMVFKIGLDGRQISVLVACMPTAVTAFVIAEKYKLDESFVANSILLSTAASVVTISGFLLASLA